jgi:hypothetical protein
MASLAYLDVLRLTGDVFMGGLMTVNELGLPTEFLYSEPLKPSRLQLSLYGSTLGRYLMIDVVGKGLIEASTSRGVPVVLARDELLPLATRVKRPLCVLSASSQRPFGEVGEVRPRESGSGEEFLAQLSEVTSPYLFSIYDRVSFPVEQHLKSFIDCAARFDLLEPQARVRRTLELLREEQPA